jgi:hypothetical protein
MDGFGGASICQLVVGWMMEKIPENSKITFATPDYVSFTAI